MFLLVESQDDGVPSDTALRVTVDSVVPVFTAATWGWVWHRAKVAEGQPQAPMSEIPERYQPGDCACV